MNENVEAFVIYMTLLTLEIIIHLAKKAQIALLITEKVIVLVDYLDYTNVFPKKLADVLSERIDINNYAIKLVDNK